MRAVSSREPLSTTQTSCANGARCRASAARHRASESARSRVQTTTETAGTPGTSALGAGGEERPAPPGDERIDDAAPEDDRRERPLGAAGRGEHADEQVALAA